MMPHDTFRCLLVEKDAAGKVSRAVTRQPYVALPEDDVLIRVAYSSLNYKDALAATGHPGVVRRFPHVPGIDAAGTVVESRSPDFKPGDLVLITGYELGAGAWGGLAEWVRAPADWIVPLPPGLSLWESMALGTAGFTAARAVHAILHQGITSDAGEVVVTGASGGVGSLAVAILAAQGYRVAAVTGKPSAHPRLRRLGASRFLERGEVDDSTGKPLLPGRYAAAVDTVGGNTLATLVRSLSEGGLVAACGLVGGVDLPLTVYPFVLRGVVLVGIDSARTPMRLRREMWDQLAGPWKPRDLSAVATTIELEQVPTWIAELLAGQVTGRAVVRLGGSADVSA
jgi:putative YhdH/YhfP family quinone oxidoreductase